LAFPTEISNAGDMIKGWKKEKGEEKKEKEN